MKILIGQEELEARTELLAAELNYMFKDTPSNEITCVPLLQGAIRFFVDTSRHFTFDPVVDYAGIRSYDGHTQMEFDLYKIPKADNIKGKTILLFDDILDTGLTMGYMVNLMYELGAKEVVPVLLIRRSNTKITWDPRITRVVVCYDIADEWIWGYGLDAIDGTGRTLNDIIYKSDN